MGEFRKIDIRRKIALVVCIIDDYTSKTVTGGNINVFIEGALQKPVNKNGYYIFVNLENREHTLRINCKYYFDEVIKVEEEKLYNSSSILYIRLKPMPNYPFDAGAGLLRLRLQDSNGVYIKNAKVEAVIVSKENYRAKVIQKQIKKGESKMSVICTGEQLTFGETLYIADEDSSEHCIIDAYENSDEGIVKLQQPLKFEHAQGALLMHAVSTFTDDKGEAVIYFKYFATKEFEVQIKLKYEGKSVLKNAVVEEGKSLYLGQIKM